MKAITLHQPYATFIADGKKRVETRSWPPPASVIGQRIAIHAAAKHGGEVKEAMRYFFPMHDFRKVEFGHWGRGKAIEVIPHAPRKSHPLFPLGCIVATAHLIGAGRVKELTPGGAAVITDRRGQGYLAVPIDEYGDYHVGRWCWFLKNVELVFEFPLARGYQGFWEWNDV